MAPSVVPRLRRLVRSAGLLDLRHACETFRHEPTGSTSRGCRVLLGHLCLAYVIFRTDSSQAPGRARARSCSRGRRSSWAVVPRADRQPGLVLRGTSPRAVARLREAAGAWKGRRLRALSGGGHHDTADRSVDGAAGDGAFLSVPTTHRRKVAALPSSRRPRPVAALLAYWAGRCRRRLGARFGRDVACGRLPAPQPASGARRHRHVGAVPAALGRGPRLVGSRAERPALGGRRCGERARGARPRRRGALGVVTSFLTLVSRTLPAVAGATLLSGSSSPSARRWSPAS